MMIMCDIGNTYLHFYDMRRIWKNNPTEINKKALGNSDIYYISVNAENEKRLLKAHKNCYNIAKIVELNTSYIGLGIDRMASCVGIVDGVIVDAGSAISLDVMDNGTHLGGYIMPGLASYLKAYAGISSALNKQINFGVDLDRLSLDTQSAMSYGTLKSIVLTIGDIAQKWQGKKLYFTGGDGKFLAKFFERAIYNEMLIFNGMGICIENALKRRERK